MTEMRYAKMIVRVPSDSEHTVYVGLNSSGYVRR